jgi:hypothetical protein
LYSFQQYTMYTQKVDFCTWSTLPFTHSIYVNFFCISLIFSILLLQVQTAMAMDESLFRGRQIKVNPKRTNRPGISTTNRGGPRGRGRGRVSRGAAMYGGYRPVRRAR